MKKIQPSSGYFLFADPKLVDSHFSKSIVFLMQHNAEGSLGFIINKKLDVMVNDLIQTPLQLDFEVFYGGPVANDTLYFVHNLGTQVPDTTIIRESIGWGGDFNYISKLIEEDKIDESNLKFFIGYAGWDANQLETEINEKSWVLSNDEIYKVFNTAEVEEFWLEKMNSLGDKFSLWANFPQNPSLN